MHIYRYDVHQTDQEAGRRQDLRQSSPGRVRGDPDRATPPRGVLAGQPGARPCGGLAGPRAQGRGRAHGPAPVGPRRAGGHDRRHGAGRAAGSAADGGDPRSRRGAHRPGDDRGAAGGGTGACGAPDVADARPRRRAGPSRAVGPHAGADGAHDAQPAGVPAVGARDARLGPPHRLGRHPGKELRHAGRRIVVPDPGPAAPAARRDRAGPGRAGANPVHPGRPHLPVRSDLHLF